LKVCALVTNPLVAAAADNAYEFKNGRELSAWLGLVPRSSDAPIAIFGDRTGELCHRPITAMRARPVEIALDQVETAASVRHIRDDYPQTPREGVNRTPRSVSAAKPSIKVALAPMCSLAASQQRHRDITSWATERCYRY
jgi:hypothetical protein